MKIHASCIKKKIRSDYFFLFFFFSTCNMYHHPVETETRNMAAKYHTLSGHVHRDVEGTPGFSNRGMRLVTSVARVGVRAWNNRCERNPRIV